MSESDAASNESNAEAHRVSQTDDSGLKSSVIHSERFNIFEVIDLVRWETVHSRFLAFLLNPKQSHGLGNSFLAGLLQKLSESTHGISLPQTHNDDGVLGRTTVHSEVYTEDGRIDILLLNEVGGWAMIIENKIDTTEHHDQLDRYYRFVETNYPDWKVLCVYLTPQGYDPSHAQYKPLNYEMICEIADRVMDEQGSTLSSDVRMSMEHYVQMVKRHIVGNPEIDELQARASQQGNGRAFAIIRDAALRHGLYARTYPWSVRYAPPANRGRSLFTVGIYDKAGRGLSLWVSLEAWTEFYGVTRERVESMFGRQQEIEDVTLRLAAEFSDKLDRLFESTATQGTD